jgi:membrane-bound lytic murein transglycosylase B
MPWWALAGIGRAESNHGRFGGAVLDGSGTATPAIIGVALNGNGFRAIGDSDQGRFDNDTVWDHAVGVMQFIPGTWNRWGEDGNGDGVIDPQNVYDAALAAAKYLCNAARPDMSTPEGRRRAFLAYNNSAAYADFVEAKGEFYATVGAGRFNPPLADAPVQ